MVAHTALLVESHAVPPAQNGNGRTVGSGRPSGVHWFNGVQVPCTL